MILLDIQAAYSRQPRAFWFLFLGFCCYANRNSSTKSPRPDPTRQSPASCPRMHLPPACLYCPLLAPPHSPRAAAHAPAAEYHVAQHLASAVPNAVKPGLLHAGRSALAQLAHSISLCAPPLGSHSSVATRNEHATSSRLLVVDIPRQQPERKRYLHITTNPSGNAQARA